ncbi:MAG: putative colanic acid biosynthesis acetyltransferase [Desulfamplus sp.]
MRIEHSKFDNSWYNPGQGFIVRIVWYFVNAIFFQSSLCPSSSIKVFLLKLFGAKIGKCVRLKPSINIKYPWNLEIGDYSWIGENVWLDSLAPIKIGNNVCISQGAYLCTGNHDWKDQAFGLIIKPIVIEDGVWVGARAIVLPGVTMATHSIATAGSVIAKNTEPYAIYSGNPAAKIKERIIK